MSERDALHDLILARLSHWDLQPLDEDTANRTIADDLADRIAAALAEARDAQAAEMEALRAEVRRFGRIAKPGFWSSVGLEGVGHFPRIAAPLREEA